MNKKKLMDFLLKIEPNDLSETTIERILDSIASKKNFRDAIFCFKFISLCEKATTDIMKKFLKKNCDIDDNKVINSIIDDLYLTGKAKHIKSLFPPIKPFSGFVTKLTDLRNNIAHGRFDNLHYGKSKISELSTKQKMFYDFFFSFKETILNSEKEIKEIETKKSNIIKRQKQIKKRKKEINKLLKNQSFKK
jgi:hypothetical protein